MKRKLNATNVPEAVAATDASQTPGFEHLRLDSRLLQAIRDEHFSRPTPVQAKTIPLVLEGKDVLGMHCSIVHFSR